MLCNEVFPILQGKHITSLFHANSVTTSRAFLTLGGLASRARMKAEGLPQTDQYTDASDQQFGVWNDVFTDSVDIHARVRDRNQYGPVLFILDTRLLLDLPPHIEIHFTKTNPAGWVQGQTYSDRYFATPADLYAGLVRGTFDHMITFRTAEGLIPFGTRLEQIVLDQPKMHWATGANIFTTAMQSLQAAAVVGAIGTPISQRQCSEGCRCLASYHDHPVQVQTLFGPP